MHIRVNQAEKPVNNPGASSGALRYENKFERSKLRVIQPERPGLMNQKDNRLLLVLRGIEQGVLGVVTPDVLRLRLAFGRVA